MIYQSAIIGCGRIGSLLEEDPLREKPCTHAGAYHSHPKIEIIAGCDINPERLDRFKSLWNINNLYTDYKELLSKHRIDILSIATEIKNHDDIVIDAAQNGIPVILCEKPISLSLKKAQNMITACKKSGTLLIINHERRFASDYHFVKQRIQRGDIGEIISIHGKILTGAPKDGTHYKIEGGGSLLHDGTHLIDMFRYFTDSEGEWVSAGMTTNPRIHVEETAWGMIQMKNGIMCTVEAGGKRDYFAFELDIHGTKGRIVIGNGILKWYQSRESQYYVGFKDLVEQEFPQFPYQTQFLNEMDAVVDYLEHKTIPQSTGNDGYKALELIYALYYSAIRSEKIFIPLPITDSNPFDEYFK